MCSDDYHQPSTPLETLSSELHERMSQRWPGRSIPFMELAIRSLKEGNIDGARVAFYNNWDKTETEPELRAWLVAEGIGPIPFNWAAYAANED